MSTSTLKKFIIFCCLFTFSVHVNVWAENSIVLVKQQLLRENNDNESMIEILSPTKNYYMYFGLNHIISWDYTGIEFIKIEYSIDEGNNWFLINSNIQASDKKIYWVPPDVSSYWCQIKLSDVDNPDIFDISDNFFIKNNFTVSSEVLPLINEIMMQNQSTIQDEDGDYSQWIELYNNTTYVIDMTGYGLSNDSSNPFMWTLNYIYLKPYEYRLIYISGKDRIVPYIHTNFTFDDGGGNLILTNRSSSDNDIIQLNPIENDVSTGRDESNRTNWLFFLEPTPENRNNTWAINKKPTNSELDSVRIWLRQNPPNGYNRDTRREKMAIIQTACDWCRESTWNEYRINYWSEENKTEAEMMEEQHPALYYLRKAHLQALDEIHNTEVTQGLAIWHMYNMGYVFKTPESCFGIDIHMREAERLVADLDFYLITHPHIDHRSVPLIEAMLAAGKPVIENDQYNDVHENTIHVNEACIFNFGNVRINVDIGDHCNGCGINSQNNMCMYQIDCGESANNLTVYHTGDADYYPKMIPDSEVDIFIVKYTTISNMSLFEAIEHVKPKITFLSHLNELMHHPRPPNAWRWSYDQAFDMIKDIPQKEAPILTWGERWLAPGTSINGEIAPPYNLVVSDVSNDNGHQLQLTWTLSPDDSIIEFYNIYRSRTPELTQPQSLESFDTFEDLLGAEEHQTILIGSVDAGENTFTDTGVPLNNVDYYYWIASVSESGQTSEKIPSENCYTVVEESQHLDLKLYENYPNPFNPVTTIEYNLPQESDITLTVYNISGQVVEILEEKLKSAGKHSITWNATDMPTGLYFCNLRANGFTETKKMLLVK